LAAANDVVDASLHVTLNRRPASVVSIHGQLTDRGVACALPEESLPTDGDRGNIARYPSPTVNTVSFPCVQSSLNDAVHLGNAQQYLFVIHRYR